MYMYKFYIPQKHWICIFRRFRFTGDLTISTRQKCFQVTLFLQIKFIFSIGRGYFFLRHGLNQQSSSRGKTRKLKLVHNLWIEIVRDWYCLKVQRDLIFTNIQTYFHLKTTGWNFLIKLSKDTFLIEEGELKTKVSSIPGIVELMVGKW